MLIICVIAFCGCGNDEDTVGVQGEVSLITREDGSGTRDAFAELLGIVDENGYDLISDTAEVTNSTAVMITSVMGNPYALGYISLGSLCDEVKVLSVDGVEPTVQNVKSGDYKVARTFNVVYKDGELSATAEDFMDFVLSAEGQQIVEETGFISAVDGESYTTSGITGKVTLAGSTSVAPVIEAMADKYKELNPDVTIEIQQTGSSAGISSTLEGVCDIGMSSRELKDTELNELKCVEIAMDGIVLIVNHENLINNLSSEEINRLYTVEISKWEELIPVDLTVNQ